MPNNSGSKPEVCLDKLFVNKLKRHPKRIVFADGEDIRVLKVAATMVELEIGAPILLGNRNVITSMAKEHEIPLVFINIIDPRKSETELFCSRLKKVNRYRGKDLVNPEEIVSRPHNFAALMVQYGHADGMIAGNFSQASSVFRAVTNMIKPSPDAKKAFGATILQAPHLTNVGRNGVLFMADCGVIPKPDVKELASIAIETGKLALHFLGRTPRIAMLSHSTHGSVDSKSAKKMLAATELARQKIKDNYLDLEIEGEVQADVAIDPLAAEVKCEHVYPVADVLVFPSMDAGNISLKLLQHIGGATAYGQFILGISKPCACVPRMVSEDELLGTVIVVAAEAIKSNALHLEEEALGVIS